MKTRLLKALALGVVCGGVVHAAAKSSKERDDEPFVVERHQGVAQAWPALGVGWVSLKKGTKLGEGALVSLAPGDKVKIASKLPGSPATFDLTGPLVFRLERDALRRIELSKEVRAEAQRNADAKQQSEDQVASLDEAWKRVRATFVGQDEAPDAKAGQPPKGAGVAGGIDLFVPQRSVTLTPGAPQEIRLSWDAKKAKKGGFRVVVKRPGSDGKEEVTPTTLDHQYVPLDAPGTYVVRVESTDGSMRSVEHKIEVLSPIPETTGEGARDAAVAVRPIMPKNGFKFSGLALPLTLSFAWIDRQREAGAFRYEVVVTTRKGVRVAGMETTEEHAELTLKTAGTFLWYVDRRIAGPGGEPSTVRSPVQTLVVEKTPTLALKQLLESKEPVTVYLAR